MAYGKNPVCIAKVLGALPAHLPGNLPDPSGKSSQNAYNTKRSPNSNTYVGCLSYNDAEVIQLKDEASSHCRT